MKEELLPLVAKKMSERGMRQQAVAAACGIDQGHLSKVLKKTVPLRKRTEERLRAWVEAPDAEDHDGDVPDMQAMLERFSKAPRARRMQIMQFLHLIDRLVR